MHSTLIVICREIYMNIDLGSPVWRWRQW